MIIRGKFNVVERKQGKDFYFEVNFDDAIAALRLTARKKAWKEENRSAPMTYDDETSELNAEIEEAAAAQNVLPESKLDDPGYGGNVSAGPLGCFIIRGTAARTVGWRWIVSTFRASDSLSGVR